MLQDIRIEVEQDIRMEVERIVIIILPKFLRTINNEITFKNNTTDFKLTIFYSYKTIKYHLDKTSFRTMLPIVSCIIFIMLKNFLSFTKLPW